MDATIARQIDAIATDAVSGATALTERAISILERAAALGPPTLADAVVRLCRAQPAMASIWNAGAAALAGPDSLARFAGRMRRAPLAIARALADLAVLGLPDDRPVRAVTWSASLTVLQGLEAIARRRRLEVSCGEGRPRLEGRLLAGQLAGLRVSVRLFTDAGVGSALEGAAFAVCGADAVGPDWAINKVGTRALAAAAREIGTPLYICAGREKLLAPELARLVGLVDGPGLEVWEQPPAGVVTVNPYFERVPIDLATVITEAGTLTGPMVAAACDASGRQAGTRALLAVLRAAS